MNLIRYFIIVFLALISFNSVYSTNNIIFSDDYEDASLDLTKWDVLGGSVWSETSGELQATGGAAWSYVLASDNTFDRNNNLILNTSCYVPSGSGGGKNMVGFHDSGTGAGYTDMVHAFYCDMDTSTQISAYEDGTLKGTPITLDSSYYNQFLDIKIVLSSSSGAEYWYKKRSSSTWILYFNSTYSSETNLKVAYAYNKNTLRSEEINLYNISTILPETPTINHNITDYYNTENITISLNTSSNVNMSYVLDGGSETTITLNTNSTTLNLYNLSEQLHNIILIANDENGEANVSVNFTTDYTAPTIDIIGNITQTDFEVNFSTIFNVTDALSGLASCTINITYLENVTNASQYDSFINCTDTKIFTAVGLYNGFVEAQDNAGNINTLSVNGTIEPIVYVNFLNSSGGNITYYDATIYHPSGYIDSVINTSNPVEISPVFNGSLDLGTYIIQFSKFGYITQNVTIDINETSGGEEYNFTIGAANIIVNIYDRTTGSLLSGPSIDINILGLSNISTTTGQALFQSFSFNIGTYSVQAISSGYNTEQKDFYYSGQANATVNLYLLEQNLTTSSTLYVPVTDEWDNIISGSDTRLLEYDSSIFGFKEVSQCYTDSNGECRFLVEVGLKTYIITTQKTINGILYQAQSSEDGEIFLPELSGGEEILGRDIIRNLKLQITDTLVTPNFYGLFINSPDTENDTITSENSTSLTIEIPVSFTATDNLAYTVCLEVYRFTNTSMFSVISPICTTGSSGIIPTTPITLNKDYDYQFWITAESGNNDKITYQKYYYLSSTSFFETLKNKHFVNPVIMLFWVLLLAFSLYLKSINIWVWGAWSLSVLQLSLFPGIIFASATVTIILINAGVLYMSKRTGDST